MTYRPALDGVRAVAIAAVVGLHAFAWPHNGGAGVDLFFVLSGFLITSILVEEWLRHGRVSLRAFYWRRWNRLMPALVVFLAAFGIYAVASGGSGAATVIGLGTGITYTTNVAGVFVSPNGFLSMPVETRPLWSLAQEEQFYLVWPLLLIVLLAALRMRRAALATGVLAGLVFLNGLRLADAGDRVMWSPDTRGLPLVVGCLAALLLTARAAAWGRRLIVPALAVVVTVMLSSTLGGPDVAFRGGLLVFSVAAALLILGAYEGGGPVARALSLPPFVFVGKISYSLYLWHSLVLAVVFWVGLHGELAAAGAVVASVGVAAASYYFVERPFLRRRRSSRGVPAAPDPSERSGRRDLIGAEV